MRAASGRIWFPIANNHLTANDHQVDHSGNQDADNNPIPADNHQADHPGNPDTTTRAGNSQPVIHQPGSLGESVSINDPRSHSTYWSPVGIQTKTALVDGYSRAAFFKGETSSVTRAMLTWHLGTPPELADLTETCQRRLVEWLDAEASGKGKDLRHEFQSIADEIELVRKKGLAVVNDYRRAWESARQIIEGLYLETDEKIGRFKSVSTVFKERTIDRTRTLFGERGEELAKHISRLDASATELRQAP